MQNVSGMIVKDDDGDRRKTRTRQAIHTAFRDLLIERGYAKLTIAGVIARANVGRSTFYEHFSTKHDLLNASLATPFAPLAAIVGSAEPSATLLPLLNHFRQNQAVVRCLFLAPTRTVVGRSLADQIAQKLALVIQATPGADPLLPVSLIAAQLAEAQLALVEAWSLGRVACRPESVAQALFAGSNAMAGALLRCALPRRG